MITNAQDLRNHAVSALTAELGDELASGISLIAADNVDSVPAFEPDGPRRVLRDFRLMIVAANCRPKMRRDGNAAFGRTAEDCLAMFVRDAIPEIRRQRGIPQPAEFDPIEMGA